MATTGAQVAGYVYPPREKPEDAFSWWLSPCGGTDLVPDDIKRVFDILSSVPDGVSSLKPPKNVKKGSGKKGDPVNPIDRPKPKAGTGKGPNGTGSGTTTKKRCSVPASRSTLRLGQAKNTLREQSCVAGKTDKRGHDYFYCLRHTADPGSQSLQQVMVSGLLPLQLGHIEEPDVGNADLPTGGRRHPPTSAPDPQSQPSTACDADEYPPAYLLDGSSPAYIHSGKNAQGQSIRYLPDGENRSAGSMWKGACFSPHVKEFTKIELKNGVNGASASKKSVIKGVGLEKTYAEVKVDVKPGFTISSWGQQGAAPPDDGISLNTCWPSGIAPLDPGFALLSFDPWYNGKNHPYDYKAPV